MHMMWEDDGENKFLVMSDKMGGTLRKGWTTTPVSIRGTNHNIDVINQVPYASYVEYGHRQEPGRYVPAIDKKLKKSWVRGPVHANRFGKGNKQESSANRTGQTR